MIAGALARRYAKALFDLASAGGSVEDLSGELALLTGVYREAPQLPALLSNPAYTRAERQAIMENLAEGPLRFSQTMRNFLRLLIENGRIRGVPEIAARYKQMANEAAGRAHVVVRSAAPLSAEQRRRLEEGFSRATAKQVTVAVEIDPSLIGGVSAHVGGLVFDGSIRAQLAALEEELKRVS
jgi:F-type H+-transporting ATPase subunit delta